MTRLFTPGVSKNLLILPSLAGGSFILFLQEAFRSEISSEEAMAMKTVLDIKKWAISRVHVVKNDHCLARLYFYGLRRAVCAALSIDKSSIRPSTKWSEIKYPFGHWLGWLLIRRRIGMRFQKLPGQDEIPRLFASTSFVFGLILVSFLCAFGFIKNFQLDYAVIGFLLFTSGLLGEVVGVLMVPFPFNRCTVGGTARLLAALNTSLPVHQKIEWTREEVSMVVDRLLVQIAGVSDFNDETFIVEEEL